MFHFALHLSKYFAEVSKFHLFHRIWLARRWRPAMFPRNIWERYLWSCDYCISLKGTLPGGLYFKDQRILLNWPKLSGTNNVLAACFVYSRARLVINLFRALASLPHTCSLVSHQPSLANAKVWTFVNLSIPCVLEWIVLCSALVGEVCPDINLYVWW